MHAIRALREMLAREKDSINRHFMYARLETLLYRFRNTFASALGEYDQACSQHDAEMDSIRAALMAELGQIPMLEIYRQMTIRQQRAHSFDQALWWAERGIAIYGDDCARPEAVEDLRHRAADSRAKIASRPLADVPRFDAQAAKQTSDDQRPSIAAGSDSEAPTPEGGTHVHAAH